MKVVIPSNRLFYYPHLIITRSDNQTIRSAVDQLIDRAGDFFLDFVRNGESYELFIANAPCNSCSFIAQIRIASTEEEKMAIKNEISINTAVEKRDCHITKYRMGWFRSLGTDNAIFIGINISELWDATTDILFGFMFADARSAYLDVVGFVGDTTRVYVSILNSLGRMGYMLKKISSKNFVLQNSVSGNYSLYLTGLENAEKTDNADYAAKYHVVQLQYVTREFLHQIDRKWETIVLMPEEEYRSSLKCCWTGEKSNLISITDIAFFKSQAELL